MIPQLTREEIVLGVVLILAAIVALRVLVNMARPRPKRFDAELFHLRNSNREDGE